MSTPMNGILGLTELLRGTPLSPQQQRFVVAVDQSGEHLLGMINDILDFSGSKSANSRSSAFISTLCRCSLTAGMEEYLGNPCTAQSLSSMLERWLPRADTGTAASTPAAVPPPALYGQAETADAEPAINPRALDSIRQLPGANGALLVNKVIDAYLADAPARLARMHSATDADNADALRKAAHGMKSSSANDGAERLAALCKVLQMLGCSGTLEGARSLLQSADQELLRVLQALMDEHATTSRSFRTDLSG
ncbi:sensor histidine kinase [Accumulibacter sp.]|uniref:Hpt domain-containing protein n=1 Tax=Accumulibacter sp. TaxID=2053492 RepID=UPI002482AFF1|nr:MULTISPECIES: sensor histidine kinase [Candidatus Accumulibacter]